MSQTTAALMQAAWEAGTAIPAFNISYLPMMEPVVAALRDTGTFGLIDVARLEFTKFEAGSVRAVADEYERCKDERFTRLHLDHIPVIDEDNQQVDYCAFIADALDAGYQSVMVDGSRLPLDGNIAATRGVVEMAHAVNVPVEAELGAVLGHEAGGLPPYEELFASKRGFTDLDEAARFVRETGADWLSVAIGNIHGAISAVGRTTQKVQARLDLEHLARLREVTGVPLVLHGGSGIRTEDIQASIRVGIAKINVATTIRQPYEKLRHESLVKAQDACYEATKQVLIEELGVAGSAKVLGAG